MVRPPPTTPRDGGVGRRSLEKPGTRHGSRRPVIAPASVVPPTTARTRAWIPPPWLKLAPSGERPSQHPPVAASYRDARIVAAQEPFEDPLGPLSPAHVSRCAISRNAGGDGSVGIDWLLVKSGGHVSAHVKSLVADGSEVAGGRRLHRQQPVQRLQCALRPTPPAPTIGRTTTTHGAKPHWRTSTDPRTTATRTTNIAQRPQINGPPTACTLPVPHDRRGSFVGSRARQSG